MGHSIHKHMNSFKASNDLKYNPVVDKASALRQNKGSMAYQKEDTPLEGNLFSKTLADNNGDYEKTKATLAPKMHGGPLHEQGEKDKDDESIAGRLGKKGLNISNEDRRDESLGVYGTRTK